MPSQSHNPMQLTLLLPRNWRPVLVDINIAMHCLGYDLATVLDMVDGGDLLWVWDLSLSRTGGQFARAQHRLLRFWMGEILDRDTHRGARIEDVVQHVVGYPGQSHIRASTVCSTLLLRTPSTFYLVQAGELSGFMHGHTRYVTRQSLVNLLTNRWLGNLTTCLSQR